MSPLTIQRHIRRVLALLLALAPAAWGAPASFPGNTTPVTLDGAPLGTQTVGSGLRNSVVQAADGTYHLWAILNTPDSVISRMVHATSTDGIHFTRQGTLSPPAGYWLTFGCGTTAATEPVASFVRVSQVGGQWIMMVWHQNQSGHTYYSYNTSVWQLDAGPDDLTPSLIGPLPTDLAACRTVGAPGRFHVGVFGMTGSRIWLRHVPQAGALAGSLGGNLGGYVVNLAASPPTSTPRPAADAAVPKQTVEANLFAGTGYYESASPVPPGLTRALVYNAGRALDQGGVIGAYYSFADYNSLAALEKELWYVESADGGTSWSAPAPLYAGQGAQVLVDGLPNTGNFSAPEVTAGGRGYFMTRDACNNTVMVTAADPSSDPRLAVAKQFDPPSVGLGEVSQLTITLQAPQGCSPAPATPAITGLGFTDTLPTGVALTGTTVSNTCNGTLSAQAGAPSLSLAGATLGMGQSCSIVVQVRGDAVGAHDNLIAATAVQNDQSLPPARAAAATLTVRSAPPPIQPVPTSTPWGLAALTAMLGVAGAWPRRRRLESKRN